MKINKLLLSITMGAMLSSCTDSDLGFYTVRDVEQAYFEGQRDALDGNVRIKLNADSCYIWRVSPWDSGKPPVYNPCYICK